MATYNPVVVDLAVTIDASGNIDVFGQEPVTVANKVVCAKELPVANLYVSQATNGAILKFQEPTGDLSSISGEIVTGFMTPAKQITFVTDLNAILNDPMNATAALPFSATKYASDTEYRNYSNFGKLALAAYADALFGHVAATAAITNDVDFVQKMNGEETGHAKLASRLALALATKNAAAATEIVKQVIGQDAARAKDEDNNALAPGDWQNLRFIAGDKIYMNINLKAPGVAVSPSTAETAQQSEPLSSAFASDISYSLEITLA